METVAKREIVVDGVTYVPSFDEALSAFVAAAQAKIDAEYAERFKNLVPCRLDKVYGHRYVKIVRVRRHRDEQGNVVDTEFGRSVFCFVDRTNGNVLKAASWKAPAKHARGNVYAQGNGADAVSCWGANYLR